MTPRSEVVQYLIKSGLAKRCVNYQARYEKSKFLREEIEQEMWVWLLTYDEDKLSDAYENGHLNALITRYLQNQLRSSNSEFYYRYRKVSEERQTQVPIETIYKDEEDNDED